MKFSSRAISCAAALIALLLLSACASNISSQVTTFHDWPSDLQEKTFTFEAPKARDADLEYVTYQKMVAAQLQRLGFSESDKNHAARLKVAIDYQTTERIVTVNQPMHTDPFFYSFRSRGLWRRGSFADPFWMDRFDYYQWEVPYFDRQLHIKISTIAGDRKLYETTVVNGGTESNMALVMPYLIQSAFTDFPGKNGEPHQVTLPVKQPVN